MKLALGLVNIFSNSIICCWGIDLSAEQIDRITQIKNHCNVVLQHIVTTVWVATLFHVMSGRRLI